MSYQEVSDFINNNESIADLEALVGQCEALVSELTSNG